VSIFSDFARSNRKNNRALTPTISFIGEEVNDNNVENDFYVNKN
jgi:hypothetical protein